MCSERTLSVLGFIRPITIWIEWECPKAAIRRRYELLFFFSSRRRHTRCSRDWSSDVCSSDLMDNGSGSALVLDMAANLKAHPESVKRSILFLLVTAEEKGLLGSKYFAAHPTIPRSEERRVGKECRSRWSPYH